MENIPNKIYLQIGEDANITIDNSVNDFNDLYIGAITWSDERINDNDIEYERRQNADLKNAALPIFGVSGRYSIDFGKHCKAKIRIENGEPKVEAAMNGWGDGISLSDITIEKL